MKQSTQDAYDAQRDLGNKAFKAGCYSPWVSLYLNTLGNISACCRSMHVPLGNIAEQSLDEIWNGERIRTMRENLQRYDFSGGCEFCGWMIEGGDYEGTIARLFDEFQVDSESTLWPQQMEFALSNACNFACIQCSSEWSSTIRSQRDGMPPLNNPYGEQFFTDLRKYLPHLKNAKFYGGEPFLSRENFRIWDMLIEDGLTPHCHVLTNGSQWNSKIERVLDALPFSIGVSLDAVSPEKLEKIRVNAKHDVIMRNMDRLRDYTRSRQSQMVISFSWMQQNWEELGPMLLHCEEHGYEINVIRVIDPPQFSLFSLPADELRAIADKLHAQSGTILPYLNKHRGTWLECVQSLYKNAEEQQATGYQEVKQVMATATKNPALQACQLADEEKWEEAVAEADKASKTDKDYYHGVAAKARSLEQLGRLDEAELACDEMISLSRRRADGFLARTWLRIAQDRPEEGLEDALQAQATLRTDNPLLKRNVLTVLARLQAHTGDMEAAKLALEDLLETCPVDANACLETARIFTLCEQPQRGLAQCEKGLAMLEDTEEGLRVELLLEMGRIRRSIKEIDKAAQTIAAAAAIEEHNTSVQLERGWVCFDQGNFSGALAAGLRAKDLVTDDPSMESCTQQLLAFCCAELGAHVTAVPLLQAHLLKQPGDEAASRYLANSRRQLAKPHAILPSLAAAIPSSSPQLQAS